MPSQLDAVVNQCKSILAQCIVSANEAAVAAASIGNAGLAPLQSPAFTGDPTAPTPATGDASIRLATTAFVNGQRGIPSGLATLDVNGVVPLAQLPFAGITFVSTWDASLNIPALVSGSGVGGNFYIVQVAGFTNLDGITTWNVGDWALFDGSHWKRVPYTPPPLSNIPLSALAGQAPSTVVANTAGGTATPAAVTISSLTSYLTVAVGDSGGGGVKGLVPAPPAGAAGSGAFLRADMIFAVPPSPNLAAYALLNSPAFVGTPTTATIARGTSSTALATGEFVIKQLASAAEVALIKANGTVSAGTSTYGAAADHIHATDLSRAPLVSPALVGTPTAPTASPSTNTTQIATTAYADAIAVLKADVNSPTLTGTASAPTPSAGDNTTKIATTAYVLAALGTVGSTVLAGSGITVVGGNTISINTNNRGGVGAYDMIRCGGTTSCASGATITGIGTTTFQFIDVGGSNTGIAVPTGQVWRNMSAATAGSSLFMRVS